MRLTGKPQPIAAYATPFAPKSVAEAWAELNPIGILCQDAQDDLKDAKRALVAAQAADVKAVAAATTAGEELADPRKHERVAQAEVDRLETLLPGYRQAADEAGNKTGKVIAQHKDKWVENLTEQTNELAATYDEALAEARLALAVFIPAQAGRNWVANFEAGHAVRASNVMGECVRR
jgi:hypothetical protein